MPRPAKSATLQLIQGNPNKKNTEELAARAEHEKKLKMRSDNIKPPTWLDKVGKIIRTSCCFMRYKNCLWTAFGLTARMPCLFMTVYIVKWSALIVKE